MNYLKVQSQCMFCLKYVNPEQRCTCSAFKFTWFLHTNPYQRGLTHCFRLQDRKLHWRPKDNSLRIFLMVTDLTKVYFTDLIHIVQ